MRRVTTIESMFNDIALPAEKRKVDLLYSNHLKGSAIIFMLRRIKLHWDFLMKKDKKQDADIEAVHTNDIKINYWNNN